ncbi:hypothetical protein [Microbacterium sp. SS28]|uniref:hypothetical protein n=1 Tax=Microbacterium sp. SS28 TaxID=2919948 RepID=UPI001FA9F341|nr:hypothetical protein [Microbacterium sp. SS28]
MENDRRVEDDLAAIAEARAAIVERSRTPRWYFAIVGVLVTLLALTVGFGTGTWWYLPAMLVVIVGEGIVIGSHRAVTGTSVPGSAWPAWLWVWAMVFAAVPVLAAAALHFTEAPGWTIVLVAASGGIAAGTGSAILNRRWEASRLTP